MPQISEEDLNSLAAKLDGLDLTETEQALLDDIIGRAEAYEPEVEGFAMGADAMSYKGNASGAGLTGTSLKLGGGLGFVTRPNLGYGNVKDPTRPPPP